MAQKIRIIRLIWENDVNFKMDTKLDATPYITIIDVDENGHLGKLWDAGIKNVCTTYFETELDIIGTEMKA